MADAWGVEPGWWDVRGEWQDAEASTIDAVRAAMDAEPGQEHPPEGPPLRVVRPGADRDLGGRHHVVLEDGTDLGALDRLPDDLPLGYHRLVAPSGDEGHLISAPTACHPSPSRAWGWAAQLYSARSRASWGIGDLADLRTLGQWAAGDGASFLAISPLHAPLPLDHQQPSPYFASSRRWRNPLHLRLEDVPGWDGGDPVLAAAARAGRALSAGGDRIDRDQIWALKRHALDHLASSTRALSDPAFRAWRAEAGEALEGYATFAALAERHGTGWRSWPEEVRHPAGPGVAAARRDLAGRITVHAWVQWLLAEQLAAALVPGVEVIHDLAIGADPDGADSWQWQDVLADGIRVGAPPDELGPEGQDWGLPPFVPWKLRAAGYRPFADLVRPALRLGGGLRVDHVMGLARLFWIPPGATGAAGTYVRFAGTEMLDVLALESVRAGAFVVGEDLGTVEEAVRDQLSERDILSYRLGWFEDRPPAEYPERAFTAMSTHDLATVAGVWTGADHDAARLRPALERLAPLDPSTPIDDVVVEVHRRLADAPSRLVSATLDDATGAVERPNVPGTTDETRPANWSLPLPVALDDLTSHPTVRRVADALRHHR